MPSGSSTLWLGPATKPSSDIEIWKRSFDMIHPHLSGATSAERSRASKDRERALDHPECRDRADAVRCRARPPVGRPHGGAANEPVHREHGRDERELANLDA